jgi:hypothetical protein
MRKLRKKDAMQEFEAEHARSEQVVQKLQAMKKQNKGRTSKTKVAEHKFEFMKQAAADNKL